MATTTDTAGPILTPEQVDSLFVQPVIARAVATDPNVATVVQLQSGRWRAPKVTADPSAAWVAEGQEIPVSDADLDEIVVEPAKLAGLTVVSSETLEDTNEQAAAVIGDGLTRDTARKLDTAFVSDLAAPAPSGLAGVDGYQEIVGDPLASVADLEAFARAAAAAENVGANVTAWLAGPGTVLALAGLREGEGSNVPLLATDPTQPARRIAEGRPILVVPDLGAGEVWGVDSSRLFTVIRTDASVESDASVFFTSDRVAIRSRMRAGFGFVHPESLVHITFSTV